MTAKLAQDIVRPGDVVHQISAHANERRGKGPDGACNLVTVTAIGEEGRLTVEGYSIGGRRVLRHSKQGAVMPGTNCPSRQKCPFGSWHSEAEHKQFSASFASMKPGEGYEEFPTTG